MATLPDQWSDDETTSGLNIHAAKFLPSLALAEKESSNNGLVAGVKEVPTTSPTVQEKLETRKESINLLFCGHVDAGKSTIGGQLLWVHWASPIHDDGSI